MDFSDYLTQKYIEWRGNAIGNERSISKYALEIGVKQPTLSQWMKKGGRKPESKEQIEKLSAYFGPEVFDVLGLRRPDAITIDQLEPGDAAALSAALAELAGVDPTTSEGFKRINEVFLAHGIKVIKAFPPEGNSIK